MDQIKTKPRPTKVKPKQPEKPYTDGMDQEDIHELKRLQLKLNLTNREMNILANYYRYGMRILFECFSLEEIQKECSTAGESWEEKKIGLFQKIEKLLEYNRGTL